jgi:hypothetical protein
MHILVQADAGTASISLTQMVDNFAGQHRTHSQVIHGTTIMSESSLLRTYNENLVHSSYKGLVYSPIWLQGMNGACLLSLFPIAGGTGQAHLTPEACSRSADFCKTCFSARLLRAWGRCLSSTWSVEYVVEKPTVWTGGGTPSRGAEQNLADPE